MKTYEDFMDKTKTLTTFSFELERFFSSILEATHAFYKLFQLFIEGSVSLGKEVFVLMLGHCVVIYRHSPTKFDYINPTEKRQERSHDKLPPRFF